MNDALTEKQKAVAFLNSIETGDQQALRFAGRYRQHNLGIRDGVPGLVDSFGPKIGFDVFRFEDGEPERALDDRWSE